MRAPVLKRNRVVLSRVIVYATIMEQQYASVIDWVDGTTPNNSLGIEPLNP
jgi:hypothetical protein